MASTPRMRKALDQVEARRRELERQIIEELEARFFSEPPPTIEEEVVHLGSAAMSRREDITTGSISPFSVTWFA